MNVRLKSSEYSSSQLNLKVLKKYKIKMPLSKLKFLLPLLPKRKVVVGNKYNSKQQKSVYVYDMNLISERLKDLGYD